jgi:hypothetical protein
MKAKKILAGVCASVMLAATAIPVVSAADSVKVTVGNTKAKAGENFSVTVDLADIPAAGINGCDFGIKFDSSVISITGVEKGALAKDDTDALDGVKSLETNVENGFVSIVYGVSGTTVTGSGTFVTLTGKVNASATAGTKADLKVVAIDRTAKPAGSETNADIIFGYLKDDNKTFVNYDPTITNGWVEVEGEAPTQAPTEAPTQAPTEAPTQAPTQAPPTEAPTQAPPTEAPTQAPTQAPPTEAPTQAPPTEAPTQVPPTQAPTNAPVDNPTQAPTQAPITDAPTQAPITDAPTQAPTQAPTAKADVKPTKLGDVDLNTIVELNDIIVLAKYLINSTAYPLNDQAKANADVNKDTLINVADLSKLIEHNLDPTGVPLN